MMATSGTRQQAMSLYRKLLRSSRSWPGPAEEKTYIREESNTLFRKYCKLNDTEAIKQRIFEGEARLEIAWHYLIPYPRPVNLPPGAIAGRQFTETAEVPTMEMGCRERDEEEEETPRSKRGH